MKKISAEIVADSINPQGNRITSFILTYPRFIHSELMTHRLFSRNAASSRAIPFNKMVQMVEEDPFIPIAWQKDHKGMQGTEYLTGEDEKTAILQWKRAAHQATVSARQLNNNHFGVRKDLVTKQLCNRLLEPFQWYTCLVTATEYDNFFELRCPRYEQEWLDTSNGLPGFERVTVYKSKKDWSKENYNDEMDNWSIEEWQSINTSQAEIHIQALAEAMWDVRNESTPNQLGVGEWHIPFQNKMDEKDIYNNLLAPYNFDYNLGRINSYKIAIATARCARLSYMTFDGEIDYEKDIKLHDQLFESKHMSPFEHCARVMTNQEYDDFHKGDLNKDDASQYGWCNNFRGFIQYRYLIENELPI